MSFSPSALITGAASGIGKAVALALHAQGVSIVIGDRSAEAGTAFAADLNKIRPGSAFFKAVDVTSWDEQVELFKFAIESVKYLTYVFPNAGVAEFPYLTKTSTTTPEWVKPDMRTLDVDLTSVLYTSHLAIQVFRTQPIGSNGYRGKIVATASIVGIYPVPYAPAYTTAKHGVVGFIRALGPQLESEKITVNCVCPNITRSGLVESALFDEVEKQGGLTPIATVVKAFLSFLGDSDLTGQAVEVSMNEIRPTSPPPHPDEATTVNINGLAEMYKALYEVA